MSRRGWSNSRKKGEGRARSGATRGAGTGIGEIRAGGVGAAIGRKEKEELEQEYHEE
jgi:hypothetical protein